MELPDLQEHWNRMEFGPISTQTVPTSYLQSIRDIIYELEGRLSDTEKTNNSFTVLMDSYEETIKELKQVVRVISPMNKELLDANQDMSYRIAKLEYLIACNIDPMNCTYEDAEICRECHKTAFPENYRL